MAPDEVKLLKPNPAGCWHCVAAMMQGLLVLCGPIVFPWIGPVSVSGIAEAPLANPKRYPAATTVAATKRYLLILPPPSVIRFDRFDRHIPSLLGVQFVCPNQLESR